MTSRFRPGLFALLALVGATAADARLGETLGDIKKSFGSPVRQVQPRKDQASWLFEGEDGQLLYTVTFNAKGQSIAEGLKPIKRARFNRNTVLDFIDAELVAIRNSPTKRTLQPRDVYHFAGKNYICGDQEYIVIDEPNGFLVIWSQAGVPSVLVLSPEMMAQM